MIDLHTHILPGMDDGPRYLETSLDMLRMEWEQGVDTVVLTPHFYRSDETLQQFIARREKAFSVLNEGISALPEADRKKLPRLLLGAEVAWIPNMADMDKLSLLCIEETNYLLLELPFTSWNHTLINQLYTLLGRTGIIPVIAHLERYLRLQRRAYIEEILNLCVSVQINADSLLNPISRGRCLTLFREGQAHMLASDCHDTLNRPPNLSQGMDVIRRKLDYSSFSALASYAEDFTRQLQKTDE